ncbi:NAD(P)-binding domain-containing protein [Fluviibacterium sp. DFM31]|uniref:NAD(P)-binding domain-containing protein n=1 Tax=Meridianimarinicoccus marinus TaxID=3231483 RepID=A0ABV3L5G3_9RHOB
MAAIGFLGTGEIAACMVRALTGQGHRLRVSDRNAEVAAELATLPDVTVHPNDEVIVHSEVVILCLVAKVARQVLADLPWHADQAVISVMVDVPLADLHRLCAPAKDIALTIPMPFIEQGGCPLPVHPDSAALREIFGPRNLILPVDSEAALNAHFAASALSAPLLELLALGAAWLAEETGDPAGSEAYVAALFKGYMSPDGSGEHFLGLLESLSTEGGLNASLRARMAQAGAPETLIDAMDGLRPRLGLATR